MTKLTRELRGWGEVASRTVAHYQSRAEDFWEGTKDHDVSQNIEALLGALGGDAPQRILDLGCGPGRDLVTFKELGHDPVGLDGCERFCEMARSHSGCEVLHQDFMALSLERESFDGVFANATLFHVPSQDLEQVLAQLYAALRPRGVLFSSNPRGQNQEGWNGERFGVYHDFSRWSEWVQRAGFEAISHYYRPKGRPREEQPWLASLWRRP